MSDEKRVSVSTRTRVVVQEKPKRKGLILIFAGIAVFCFAVLIQQNQQVIAPAVSGIASGIAEQVEPLPDHPSTSQMITWGQRCQAGQAPADTCSRLNALVTAKLQACTARLGTRDYIAMRDPRNQSPANWLRYCDDRFPDMR